MHKMFAPQHASWVSPTVAPAAKPGLLLRCRNLSKWFDPKILFRQVELDLARGECLVVAGWNGSGKSTFLKCLAGLIDPSTGSVEVISEKAFPIGYSALDLELYGQLSAREHLVFAAQTRGCKDDAEFWLDYVGLEDRDLQASSLSSGQRQRVRFALALQHRPDLLFLDEPSAAMDEKGRALVAKVIDDFRMGTHSGIPGAIALATNDPQELTYATHLLELTPEWVSYLDEAGK